MAGTAEAVDAAAADGLCGNGLRTAAAAALSLDVLGRIGFLPVFAEEPTLLRYLAYCFLYTDGRLDASTIFDKRAFSSGNAFLLACH